MSASKELLQLDLYALLGVEDGAAPKKIIRLREEGSRQLQEEQRLIKEQIQREREVGAGGGHRPPGTQEHKLALQGSQLKWKSKKGDETNGGYSHDVLLGLLHKELAFKNEHGLTSNPLKISWLEGQPAPAPSHLSDTSTQDSLVNEASVSKSKSPG
ncbi:UNVERIFIED_CONTAM: hypothetical protein FKN15_008708 [Acipenser sinensis]